MHQEQREWFAMGRQTPNKLYLSKVQDEGSQIGHHSSRDQNISNDVGVLLCQILHVLVKKSSKVP